MNISRNTIMMMIITSRSLFSTFFWRIVKYTNISISKVNMETYNMNLQDVVSIMYVYTRKKQKSVAAKQWLCHVVWLIGKGRRKKQVHAKFCICHLVIYMMTFICYFDTSGITCIVSEYYISCTTRCNTYNFFKGIILA